MSIEQLLFIFSGGLVMGLFLALFWNYLEKQLMIQKTKTEGEHHLQEAQEKADHFLEQRKKDFQARQEQKLKLFEKETDKLKLKIKEMEAQTDKRSHQLKLKSQEREVIYNKIKKEIYGIQQIKSTLSKEKESLSMQFKTERKKIQRLSDHFSIDLDSFKEWIKKDIQKKWTDRIRKELEQKEKQNIQNLQKDTSFYLNVALSRFDRICCRGRGISAVDFQSKAQLEKIIGPEGSFLKNIEKECGVDILVNKTDLYASVFGIDPVRRELGRIVLKKLARQNKINHQTIQKTTKRCKKNLFAKICQDGKTICRKLGLKNVDPEVKNMMGALRYRYSFAQNQYFHCEEVGWLCGLLNAELDLSVKKAKRAGMFHDIGKAMDHSIDGNHAVIGADFLSKYKESEDVLHAVRAHHHDVPPSSPLAYLVIAADAISGSRPGARRFTEDSYNQKMANLEKIIDSFDNIEDAYIMSAGREMRVIVDNKKISDKGALDLSKLIARKIEKERFYPGLIKVTVVRHSEQTATA